MRYGYNSDGLKTDHCSSFLDDPKFINAYGRGKESLVVCKFPQQDLHWAWRVYNGLWAAKQSIKLDGDFVECGTATGFMASAICEYLDWNSQDKTFHLFDRFKTEMNSTYPFDKIAFSDVVNNFSQWKRVEVNKVEIKYEFQCEKVNYVSFLHLDMNNLFAEEAAFIHFWPKIVKGGIVLLDDYGYNGYKYQKIGFDNLAKQFNFNILSMPTGQGLIIKN